MCVYIPIHSHVCKSLHTHTNAYRKVHTCIYIYKERKYLQRPKDFMEDQLQKDIHRHKSWNLKGSHPFPKNLHRKYRNLR